MAQYYRAQTGNSVVCINKEKSQDTLICIVQQQGRDAKKSWSNAKHKVPCTETESGKLRHCLNISSATSIERRKKFKLQLVLNGGFRLEEYVIKMSTLFTDLDKVVQDSVDASIGAKCYIYTKAQAHF